MAATDDNRLRIASVAVAVDAFVHVVIQTVVIMTHGFYQKKRKKTKKINSKGIHVDKPQITKIVIS